MAPSILREELSDEQIAMDMDDAVRLNAAGVGIQVFVGGEHETRSIHNMTKLIDAGLRVAASRLSLSFRQTGSGSTGLSLLRQQGDVRVTMSV